MNKTQDIFSKCYTDQGYFGALRVTGDRFFSRPTLPIRPSPHMKFDNRQCIMWSINDYLGFANHPEVIKVAQKSLEKYGISSPMGSRMMSGTTKDHLALEEKIAQWVEKEASYVFNYGYLGVLGVVSSLATPKDIIIMDKLSHACIVDAAFLSRAKTRIFKHNNMEDLEKVLASTRKNNPDSGILILIEGVYGMTGDLAPINKIIALKKKYHARVFIDDAHGCGVLGEKGRGTGAYYQAMKDIDIYFGTFAKAFGAIGGFAAADKAVIEWIGYNARTQVFAKSLPIIYVHSIDKMLDLIIKGDDRRATMWERSHALKDGLKAAGFTIGKGTSPIVSTYMSIKEDAPHTSVVPQTVSLLRHKGIFVTAVIHPVIPQGLVMYRMIPTANHSTSDIQRTIRAFQEMKQELDFDTSMTSDEKELIKKIYVNNE